MIGREDEVRDYRGKIGRYGLFMALAFGILLLRLTFLQIVSGEELRKFSETNRLKKEKLHPTRGIIYDRNGKVIVDNRASFDVVVSSQYYNFSDETNRRLSVALKMDLQDLEKKLTKAKRGPRYYLTLLKGDVDKDVIAAIETDALSFPGIDIEATVKRRYPDGDLAAQVLGYTSEVDPADIAADPEHLLERGDYIGRMGIEKRYDKYLRGVNGYGYVEVDSVGRRRKAEGDKILGFVQQTEPKPGDDIHLTLDWSVQTAARDAMRSRGFLGSVVALDPRNGEILAMLSEPSFDPEAISGRDVDSTEWQKISLSKDRPLRNRAIQDIYPPGSTFKLFMAIAALAEKVVTTDSTFQCNGGIQFGGRRFNCWKKHGPVSFVKAIKESCDVYFYNVGLKLGIDKIAKYARLFGLGEKTDLGLFQENAALIPDTAWKKQKLKQDWYDGETLSVSIGQGYVSVTPIQMALGFSAISNRGFVYKPFVVQRVQGKDGAVRAQFQPELRRRIDIDDAIYGPVKEGLSKVLNEPGGTAFLSKSKLTEISGKTGTAQIRGFADIMKLKCESMERSSKHHGWFVGYAPRENPEIVVSVVAEHACHGSSAAPVVRDVIEAYMRLHAVGELKADSHEKIKSNEAITSPDADVEKTQSSDEDE